MFRSNPWRRGIPWRTIIRPATVDIPRAVIIMVIVIDTAVGNLVGYSSGIPVDVLIHGVDVDDSIQIHLVQLRVKGLDYLHSFSVGVVVVLDETILDTIIKRSIGQRNLLNGSNSQNSFLVVGKELRVVVGQDIGNLIVPFDNALARIPGRCT